MMLHRKRAVLHNGLCLSLLLLVLIACRPAPPVQDDPDPVLSTVDGYTISVRDFEASYVHALIRTGQNDTPANRYAHLARLADAALLADEAERRGYDTGPDFEEGLERTRRQAVGGRFFEVAFLETLPPLEDAEIRSAYLKSKQQVVVRHLFYRTQSAAEAAYARLQAGRPFLEEAADCYNLAAVDSAAGYLGPIRYFQVDDAFAEAAFALAVGDVSKPVRSRFGYHIIRAEEKYVPALLSESEYQTRRQGTKSQLALRTRRLEGDRFVRSFMDSLNVQVNAPAVRSLAEAIESLEGAAQADPLPVELSRAEVQHLRTTLEPDTPLATFVLNGETVTLTASDYFLWLPELPFAEALNRTGASVGRALRNEALYRAGLHRGLDSDPQVVADVDRGRRGELARRLRDSLQATPPAAIPEAELRAAYERQPPARQWTADFWTLTFDTQAEAEAARRILTDDPARAATYATYTAYTAQDLVAVPQWAGTVRKAPLRQVMMAHQPSGTWALVYVAARTAHTPDFAAVRDTLAQTLAPRYSEYALLARLYAQAQVTTDTLLFEQIMQLDAN